MKKAFLYCILSLFISNLFAQERTNKVLPKIGTEIKGQLSKATGWLLNPEGQWISRQNRIPVYIENEFKSLIDYEKRSLGLDNFISFQLREVTIEDSIYSILIKKYKNGSYKYEAIEKEWREYSAVRFYIFSNSELKKIKTLKSNTTNFININILYDNSIEWIKDETYITDIEKKIALSFYKSNAKDVIEIAPYKIKNIVQFKILSPFYQDNCYYETDYTSFQNLFKIEERTESMNTENALQEKQENLINEGSDKLNEEDEELFTIVEEMPTFPGGDVKMLEFINNNIKYPGLERENSIEGTVYVSFVVNKEGEIIDAKTIRGIPGGPNLDKEAVRVINSMPKWTPGKQNGKLVFVQFTLPVRFAIK